MSHQICGNRLAITLWAVVAGCIVFAGAASAQQQAPAAKPAAAPKPAAPKAPAAAAPAALPAPGGAQPALLGQYGDWGAYTAAPGGKKICFALAKPASSSTSPPNRPRDPAYMFVSTRPAEKVKDEVSVIFGYGLKPNSDANIEVAGGGYAMYTQGDGAWLKNAAEEPKLVETMRKGQNLTVKGTSARGTVSTDIYSLKGLSLALDKVAQECR
ncbi:MAG TPA: invasion associated locus B family protein [Xanthobacteraceae bacterium]|nr:invasion associated locus B family protein [Xanthobacteraceae bacterium]